MVRHNFEGDITGIRPSQLEFISGTLEKLGFKECKVTVEPVGKPGENYVAEVKRITAETENGMFNMIAKIMPENDMAKKMAFTRFKNEHAMFTEVIPKFDELQKKLTEDEKVVFPKCYGSSTEASNELLLLEDLAEANFVVLDRFQPLSDDCVKSILRNLAIFHSLSYVLKNKEPEKYELLKNNLTDIFSSAQEAQMMEAFFQQVEAMLTAALENEKHKQVIKGSVSQMGAMTMKMAKADAGSKYLVIQHGDTWISNFMFLIENGKPSRSIMIDYQQAKECNPVCDILYMTFACTDYETRKQHFHEWIDFYHNELDKSLHNFGLKANFIYPKDQLDADLKRYSKMMFAYSVLMTALMTRKAEEASKMQEELAKATDLNQVMDSMAAAQTVTGLFKARLEGLIDSFIEFGLL